MVNQPIKRPEPVLVSDKPWDAFRLIFFTVAEDNGQFRMWYQAFDGDQWAGGKSRLCYAVSQDGLHFHKPNLGIVEYGGNRDNNLVLEGMFNAYVFVDPRAQPGERYKLIHSSFMGNIRAGVSPDGIHWKLLPQDLLSANGVGYDIQNVAFWDARRSKYVIYLRVLAGGGNSLAFPFVDPVPSDPPVVAPKEYRPGRAVGILMVDDILAPWPADDIRTVLAADELDPPDSDIYTHYPYQYPYAADAYFLFPLTYQHFRATETTVGNDGVNDCIMCASRDGVHWMRHDRRAYLQRGLRGEEDAGMVQTTGCVARAGNYLYHYYSYWPWSHGGFRKLTAEERASPASWGRSRYMVAIQRLDGFVSADAPYDGGWLVTPPLVFKGDHLELNTNVDAMGAALVEIEDAEGKPVPGFTLEECDRILFNDVAHTVNWGGKTDVSMLVGKPVRLRIYMRSAKLYAFQFRGGGQ